MKLRGEITVFLSLSMLCVFALLCVMVESARTAGSRYYFQTAVNASLDSLFSQYHRALWQQYRIFGLYHESEEELGERLQPWVDQYLETENWYPIRLERLEPMACRQLTDQSGDFFALEVEEYMKYGIWTHFTFQPEEGGRMLSDLLEAAGAGVVADSYDGQEKEVQKLEQAVDQILECVEKQEEEFERVENALSQNEPGEFRKAAGRFLREEGRMEGLLNAYDRQAEKLGKRLSDSRSLWRQVQGDFQGENRELLEEQMNPYEAYVKEDGERRQQLLHQKETGEANVRLLGQVERQVEELEAEYEAEWTAYSPESGDSEPSLSLSPAASRWQAFIHTELVWDRGQKDTGKRKLLERVRSMAQGGLLQLVLPEGAEISSGKLSLADAPSEVFREASQEGFSIIRQVLLGEYAAEYFVRYGSEEKRQVQYELEYILQGKARDRENLEETVSQIFLLRQGVNFLQILADPSKREEARTLALAITGAAGLAPLTDICACFVMGVWAMGEAVADLRALMAGGAVPLWKRKDEWKLSLEGLLSMGEAGGIGSAEGQPEKKAGAFDYEDYLKLLLLMEDVEDKQMRMLDVIQMNVRRKEPGFLLEQCVYQVDIRGEACGKHVFFTLPFVEKLVGGTEGYPLAAEASRAY